MVRGTFVRVRDGESMEGAIRRLKRSVEKEGKPRELREREFYRKRSAIRKREQAAAKKRFLKKIAREQQIMRGNQHNQAS
jgi:small subunit ribosomal protein S21